MTKIITGKTIYDDFISSCWNGLYYESGSVSTKPTYVQVMEALLSSDFDSFKMFYDCDIEDQTKCAICLDNMDQAVDLVTMFADAFNTTSSNISCCIGDSYPYLFGVGDVTKAITTSEYNSSDLKIYKSWKFFRARLNEEINGIYSFPGSCQNASLKIYVNFNDGTGSHTIGRIDNLGDREHISLDYNPYMIAPSWWIAESCPSITFELKLPGQASAIGPVTQYLSSSYISVRTKDNTYNIPAIDVATNGISGTNVVCPNCGSHYANVQNLVRCSSCGYVFDNSLTVKFSTENIENFTEILDIRDLDIRLVHTTLPSVTVDLNNQWQTTSTPANPNSSSYAGVYRSASNYNVNSGVSIMKIEIENCENFTLYIRSFAETTCDYVMVSQLDQTITGTTSTTSSAVKAHTSGNQQSGTAISNYTQVTYTGITSGKHTITVVYKKDSSVNSNDDRGYVLIGKQSGMTITEVNPHVQYGSLYIPWSSCFVETWSGSRIYLSGNTNFMGLSNTNCLADCFAVNDYYPNGMKVRLTGTDDSGFTVNKADGYEPYGIYGNDTMYIKVPVAFYNSNYGGNIYSYVYVPVGVNPSGFSAVPTGSCAISMFGQSSSSTSYLYLELESASDAVNGVSTYNGLVSESNPIAFYNHLYSQDSIGIPNNNSTYNENSSYCYGAFANNEFMIMPYNDFGPYELNMYYRENRDYKYTQKHDAGEAQYFSLIPDEYNNSSLTFGTLLNFWGQVIYSANDNGFNTFCLSIMPT